MKRVCLFIFVLICLVGCGSVETPTVVPTEVIAQATSVLDTSTPTSEPTVVPPTKTPRPTWTIIPTNTPQTATPVPTATEAATAVVVESAETQATVSAETPISSTPTSTNPDPTATNPAPTSTNPAPTSVNPNPTSVNPNPTAIAPAPTAVPPPATTQPAPPAQPTATPISATATPLPPTNTPQPPTSTPIPQPTSTPAPQQPSSVSISSLGALPADSEVTITGNIINSASFSNGFKFTVNDGTGSVTLLMWHNVYDDCWDKNVLNVGATVVATGNTGSFDGELQVVPWWGGGVDVTAPAYAYAAPHTVSELGQFMGQRAMIEGEVTKVDVTETFTKINVNDGTGEVEVFLWSNVWVRVPNKDAIAVGRRLKAVGVVGEFRGTLQLSPPLPYDIILQ